MSYSNCDEKWYEKYCDDKPNIIFNIYSCKFFIKALEIYRKNELMIDEIFHLSFIYYNKV